MTTTVPDPINSNQQQVLVRNSVTGFEQGIAAVTGLLTAGPLGALAAWGAIRGLQGKWTPWVIIGVPVSMVLNVVQLFTLAVIIDATSPNVEYNESTKTEQVSTTY